MTTQSSNPFAAALCDRFARREATIGVVGLGYVGLPLVRAVHDAGFRVIGFDIDREKIELLRAGKAYLKHLGDDLPRNLMLSARFRATDEPKELALCDVIVLCVPTPLGKHQEPDLSYVERSTAMVAGVIGPGKLVSLESTSYPGTTREVCKPILESRGLTCGTDLFLVFSPEREDPGRQGTQTKSIPRLVGGVDELSADVGAAFYGAAIETVIRVDSAETAEAAKLLENIYRAVNIALVNELKPLFSVMGVDIWKVIEAASTKPYGFQPFHPGPGLGGHCIPIDPYYLTYKAREFHQTTRFIELAGEINNRMPRYVVDRLSAALNDDRKSLRGSRVLIVGLAYKPNVDDVRETPAAEIIRLLKEAGAEVSYHDPHVAEFPEMRKYSFDMRSIALTPAAVAGVDAAVIVTNHDAVDYALLGMHAKLVVDTRNAMSGVTGAVARIVHA